jgi:hypothetical protein
VTTWVPERRAAILNHNFIKHPKRSGLSVKVLEKNSEVNLKFNEAYDKHSFFIIIIKSNFINCINYLNKPTSKV